MPMRWSRSATASPRPAWSWSNTLSAGFTANFDKGYDEAAIKTLTSETSSANIGILAIVAAAVPKADTVIEVTDLELPKKEAKDKKDSQLSFFGPSPAVKALLIEKEEDKDLGETSIYISFRSVRGKDHSQEGQGPGPYRDAEGTGHHPDQPGRHQRFQVRREDPGLRDQGNPGPADKIIASVRKVGDSGAKSETNRAMSELEAQR